MTQRRQTRASASSAKSVVVSKRQSTKENAVAPRTRGGTQTRKSLSLSKTVKSTTSNSLRRKTTSTLLSSKVTTKPVPLKKNVAKKIGKPSAKIPVASKSSPSKLSAKSSKSDPKQKTGKPVKNSASSGKKSSPKKLFPNPLNAKQATPKSIASNVPKSSPRFLKITNIVSLNNSSSSKETVKISGTKLTVPSVKKDTPNRTPSKRTQAKQTSSEHTAPKQSSSKQALKPKQVALKQSPRSSPRRSPLKQLSLKKSPQSSPRQSPSKQSSLKQSPQSSPRRSPSKQTLLKQSPQSSPRRSPLKQAALNQPLPSPSRRSPLKQATLNQPLPSPSRRSPSKPTLIQRTPSKQTPKQEASSCSPKRSNRSSRKRLLPSPAQSPHSPKMSKLRGDVESVELIKIEKREDDVALKVPRVGRPPTIGRYRVGPPRNSNSETELPTAPELSNSFLRRKWFSLKARGGFTCLRSAVLSPQEVVKEVINHSKVDQSPADPQSDFFTTKLMVRLASRLPPVKSRPSCEELVDLINSEQNGFKFKPQSDRKKEVTAIRVKLEGRSFSDTLSHIKNKPVKSSNIASQAKNSPSNFESAKRKGESKPEPANQTGDGSLTEMQEREIALRQLKDLSASEPDSPASGKSSASSSTNPNPNDNNRKRWFSLKSRGASSCLRSAILSPEELTAEFMKRTRVDPQTCLTAQSLLKQESRGSYKGVSTDELVSLIQTKQMEKHLESLKPKGEEGTTANTDTEKTREKQLALQQLNVLRYW